MNRINIRPLQDRVIIEPLKEQTTVSGILIPESVGEKPQRGLIIAVGPGKIINQKHQSLSVSVGDKVFFGKYSGNEIELNGKKILVMREEDVMAVIEDE